MEMPLHVAHGPLAAPSLGPLFPGRRLTTIASVPSQACGHVRGSDPCSCRTINHSMAHTMAHHSFAQENSVYYVASPEACAAILWKSRDAINLVGAGFRRWVAAGWEGWGGVGSGPPPLAAWTP